MSEAPVEAAALIAEYLDFLRHEKKYSAHTVAAAARDLSRFADHCGRARVPLLRADEHLVRSLAMALHRDGLSAGSIQRLLSSLRSFLRYQLRRDRVAFNAAVAVRGPRLRRKLPGVVGAEELGAALDQVPGDVAGVRDRAIVELLYSTGLRLAELHGLDAAELAGDVTELRVRGKGGKERIVMIGRRARAALDAWLQARATLAAIDEPALFVGARGARLSRGGIACALKAFGLRTGLPARLHPHRLRHSFATHVLESSGDLRAVQELLGHAHLSTTQVYTHLDWKRLAKVYDDAHPRARKAADGPDAGKPRR